VGVERRRRQKVVRSINDVAAGHPHTLIARIVQHMNSCAFAEGFAMLPPNAPEGN
jgi:hypothetical protein